MSETAMESAIIGLLAETGIHVGVGQSVGALDLPVARERTTDYPFIPGSGVKGALRVWAEERAGFTKDKCNDLFGASGDTGGDGEAGKVLMSDARLLLLPVRSLSSAYRWVTCPLILDRLKRDANRSGATGVAFAIPEVGNGCFLGDGDENEIIGLEEREFKRSDKVASEVIDALGAIIPDSDVAERVGAQLVILSNDDFSWFAKYALPVMARNVLEKETKKSENLWYEESLPPDTVMYLLLGERKAGKLSEVKAAISGDKAYVQMGGNETVGQGWFIMAAVAWGAS